MIYETRFLIALVVTLVIEVPLLAFLLRNKVSKKLTIVTGLIATVLTLPYLWFVLPPYIGGGYYLEIGELIVILIEALIFHYLLKIKMLVSLKYSVIVNTVSYFIGVLLIKILF